MLFSSKSHGTLPDHQLLTVSTDSRDVQLLPLAQASAGCVATVGGTPTLCVVLFVCTVFILCFWFGCECILLGRVGDAIVALCYRWLLFSCD